MIIVSITSSMKLLLRDITKQDIIMMKTEKIQLKWFSHIIRTNTNRVTKIFEAGRSKKNKTTEKNQIVEVVKQ